MERQDCFAGVGAWRVFWKINPHFHVHLQLLSSPVTHLQSERTRTHQGSIPGFSSHFFSVRTQLDFRSLPRAISGQAQSAKNSWQLPQLPLHVLWMDQGAAKALAWARDGSNPLNPLNPPGHLQHLHSRGKKATGSECPARQPGALGCP